MAHLADRPVVRNTPIAPPDRPGRRTLQLGLLFVASVLVANAFVGDRGLFASRAAARAHHQLATEIDAIKSDNDRLRITARQLRDNPDAIEALARQELGLIRPGEIVFLLHGGPGVGEDRPDVAPF